MFKVESGLPDSTSWWVVFAPLFVSDALNTYFCAIVLIRMYIEVSLDIEDAKYHQLTCVASSQVKI